MEIVERIAGYTDAMMHNRCCVYARIMHTTIEKKIGRGKSAEVESKLKYKTEQAQLDKINRSVKYYLEQMRKEGKTEIEFRDYQKNIISEGTRKLKLTKFLYLAMEVRTGKTLTSLGICSELGVKNVLFLTKKKAISSIEGDYTKLNPSYNMTTINYESMHKIPQKGWDVIVCDEAHGMGAFPKPSKRAKDIKKLFSLNKAYVILLSGTPTPESYCQMYHQVYGIKGNPFHMYKNFYRFCDDYVDIKSKFINSMAMNDYSGGKESILAAMKPFTINYSQKEAGFKVDTREHILYVEPSKTIANITKRLKKDLVVEGKEEVILADTPVKLMMKLHQLYSGTVKFESGNSAILDKTKAEYIHDNFGDKKIGIFYKFTAELEALKEVYGDKLCTTLEEFNGSDKTIALQVVAGREGISLREADALVYYNIDFSATSYWQSRDRMTTKERLESDVYWIFTKGGIEDDIYKAVSKKKNFTVNHFKKTL